MAEPAALVRTLTGLTAADLDDDQITALLELHAGDVKLAGASALESVAAGLVDVTSDDITLSGSRRAATLMALAGRLREQAAADAADDDFYFDVVPATGHGHGELAERRCW